MLLFKINPIGCPRRAPNACDCQLLHLKTHCGLPVQECFGAAIVDFMEMELSLQTNIAIRGCLHGAPM